MNKLIKLTKVIGDLPRPESHFGESLTEGESDAPAVIEEETCVTAINVEQVRDFYPRRGGRVGTRIVFRNGAGCPVKETFDEVFAAFASLNN